MKGHLSIQLIAASVASGAALLYGARAAAFIDPGADAILGDLLANSVRQLTTANDTLGQVTQSNAVLKGLERDREASIAGTRSFQVFAARRFGDSYLAELDTASSDPGGARRSALQQLGMGNSGWAQIDDACPPSGNGRSSCSDASSPPGTSQVLHALTGTFGTPGQPLQEVRVVDAEAAAAIEGGLVEDRLAAVNEGPLHDLVKRCSHLPGTNGDSAAQELAEQCSLASELSQVLHLEEGQQTNAKLAELARLQALAVEQKNADLKRDMLEQEARRAALTGGLESLARTRVAIRTGGPAL
jgi:hypothetical protein